MRGRGVGGKATMLVDRRSGFRLGGRNDELGRWVLGHRGGLRRLSVRPSISLRTNGQPRPRSGYVFDAGAGGVLAEGHDVGGQALWIPARGPE